MGILHQWKVKRNIDFKRPQSDLFNPTTAIKKRVVQRIALFKYIIDPNAPNLSVILAALELDLPLPKHKLPPKLIPAYTPLGSRLYTLY